ncbi:uncharacterized protein LOC142403201 [Mycteria americana]|uniref:uncharacterized protein LOC142403201 n=1 Tax=Mycteria americana TaxID=33587 RepID=UPI003F581225
MAAPTGQRPGGGTRGGERDAPAAAAGRGRPQAAEKGPHGGRAGPGPREPGLRRAPRHPERLLRQGGRKGGREGGTDGRTPPPPRGDGRPARHRQRPPVLRYGLLPRSGAARKCPSVLRKAHSMGRWSSSSPEVPVGPPERALYGPVVLQLTGSARRSSGTRTLWAGGPPAHRKCPSVLRNAHSMGRWSSSSPEVPVGPPERALYGPVVLQLTGSARRSSGMRTLWAGGPPAHRKCPSVLRNAHSMG